MFKKSRIWFYYGIWQFEHALEGVISTYKDSFQGWLSSRSRAPTYYELVRLRLTRSVGGCTLPTTKHPLKESLYVEKTPSHASKPPNPIVKSNSLFFKHIIVIHRLRRQQSRSRIKSIGLIYTSQIFIIVQFFIPGCKN